MKPRHHNTEMDSIIIRYPFQVFRKDQTLVDPLNTESTYQYYLVENLGLGLVRDDARKPGIYMPALAEQWRQLSSNSWEFVLQKNLRWSSGREMRASSVKDHFVWLREQSSRHVMLLKGASEIQANDAERSLIFRFQNAVGEEALLHELSLADSVLYNVGSSTKGWAETSGAYYVAEYDVQTPKLVLRANRHSPLWNQEMIQEVTFYEWPSEGEMPQVFMTLPTDVMYLIPPGFRKMYEGPMANAAQKIVGQPVLTHYFSFHGRNPLARDEKARKELAWIFHRALSKTTFKWGHYDSQFLPLGYVGRLTEFMNDAVDVTRLKGRTIGLKFHAAFEGYPEFVERTRSVASEHGVTLDIQYGLPKMGLPNENSQESPALLAEARMVVTNQRDPVGGWSFLFSGTDGLGVFRMEIEPLLTEVVHQSAHKERRRGALEELHRTVLNRAYGVPFWVEELVILASERVDLSAVNPFDMRPRFYEMRWAD